MKSHKNDVQLLKFALEIGIGYAKKRGFDDFDRGVSLSQGQSGMYLSTPRYR